MNESQLQRLLEDFQDDALNEAECRELMAWFDEDGSHVGGLVGFLKSIRFAINKFKPTRCIIVFDGTLATSGTVEPEARPLDVRMRTVAQGRTHDSLSTSTGVLILLCHITEKATSKLFNIKLAFKED